MKFGRRSFLKMASGLAVAVAAPLYIPAERLEMGVPRKVLAAEPVGLVLPNSAPLVAANTSLLRDDTAFIQGLIDEGLRTGRTVHIPSGTWYISSLMFDSGLDLKGSDETILQGLAPVDCMVAAVQYDGRALLRTEQHPVHDVRFSNIRFHAPVEHALTALPAVQIGDIPLYDGPLGLAT